MSEEESTGEVPENKLEVLDKKEALAEVYVAVEILCEQQKLAREKIDSANKALRDCQLGLKGLSRQLKTYERESNKRLKEIKQAEELIAKLHKINVA